MNEQLREGQKGSIIGMVNEIFFKGVFDKPKSGEKDFTDYEKAILTAYNRTVEENNSAIIEHGKTNKLCNKKRWLEIKAMALTQRYEALDQLLSLSRKESAEGVGKEKIDEQGPVIGWLNEIFLKKEFIDPSAGPVEEEDEIVGIMNDYEKAISTACVLLAEECSTLIDKNGKTKDIEGLAKINEWLEMMNNLFWSSLRLRLGVKGEKTDSITIRDGYKIVIFNQQVLSIAMMSPRLEIVDFGLVDHYGMAHYCGECPEHGKCNFEKKIQQ
jgi:hypothetical protein